MAMTEFPIDQVRAAFPALLNEDDFIFFDNAAGAQSPATVLNDVSNHLLNRNVKNIRISQQSNDVAEAISLLERALALNPGSDEAQSQLANALVSRVADGNSDSVAADIERAKGLVTQVLAASPHNPIAHLAKAQLLRTEHRYEEAIPEYETVIALNRNVVPAYRNLGTCKLWTG